MGKPKLSPQEVKAIVEEVKYEVSQIRDPQLKDCINLFYSTNSNAKKLYQLKNKAEKSFKEYMAFKEANMEGIRLNEDLFLKEHLKEYPCHERWLNAAIIINSRGYITAESLKTKLKEYFGW